MIRIGFADEAGDAGNCNIIMTGSISIPPIPPARGTFTIDCSQSGADLPFFNTTLLSVFTCNTYMPGGGGRGKARPGAWR